MRRSALAVVLALPLLVACASHPERWAVLRFERLSYNNLFEQVADSLDGSGYRVQKRDPAAGTIETDWEIGEALRELRGPARRKVIARVSSLDDESYEVRVRVAVEVIRRGGLLAREIRNSKDWEAWKDDYDEAAYLAARLGALLHDYRVRVSPEEG